MYGKIKKVILIKLSLQNNVKTPLMVVKKFSNSVILMVTEFWQDVKWKYVKILNLLNNLQKELDLSYIFISHDMRVIRSIANKIIVLKDGLIVEEDYCKDIFISPKSEYTKKLISSVI